MGPILDRLYARWLSLLAFSLAWRAISMMLLAPCAAFILRICLWQHGRPAAGNFEIAAFFLAPAGWAAILVIGAIVLATQYFEHAGLMRLWLDGQLRWWQAILGSRQLYLRLVQLGLRQVGVYCVLAIPFLAGAGLAYWWLLSGQDINGLLILKPPEFWQAVTIAGALVAIYAAIVLYFAIRWLLATPILCFEPDVSPRDALRQSGERMFGGRARAAGLLALCGVTQAGLTLLVFWLLSLVAQPLLAREESSLAAAALTIGLVLGVNWLAGLCLNVLASLSLAGVVLHLYRASAPPAVLAEMKTHAEPGTGRPVILATSLLLALACTVSLFALSDLSFPEGIEITAHRAGAAHGPENTIAALQRAIVDRADWAEIDVQLTADEALVIMHDTDLARVGGGKRRVDQATLAEIQALDVGTLHGAEFAGERIPTLQQFLTAAKDQIRLNVELKPHGAADGPNLTRRVVAEIQAAGMSRQCRICSQSYESIQLAKQLEPQLEIGYIAGAAVGDPAQLKADFLMLNSSLINSALVHRAASRGVAVHAWTVNSADQVGPLLDQGVANLITDDPVMIRSQIEALRALNPVQRLLLRARTALR